MTWRDGMTLLGVFGININKNSIIKWIQTHHDDKTIFKFCITLNVFIADVVWCCGTVKILIIICLVHVIAILLFMHIYAYYIKTYLRQNEDYENIVRFHKLNKGILYVIICYRDYIWCMYILCVFVVIIVVITWSTQCGIVNSALTVLLPFMTRCYMLYVQR